MRQIKSQLPADCVEERSHHRYPSDQFSEARAAALWCWTPERCSASSSQCMRNLGASLTHLRQQESSAMLLDTGEVPSKLIPMHCNVWYRTAFLKCQMANGLKAVNHCVQSKRNVLRQSSAAQSYQGSDPAPPPLFLIMPRF